jgi:demethylmenaquinone methyltransferase/2-methoxy-6-polyprenyl-1,4-benzoquinol methylase
MPISAMSSFDDSPRPAADGVRGGSGAMFDRIARRYDLLNRLSSFGRDRAWRRTAVAALDLAPGHRVLDLATGTADVALEVLRQQPAATVVGIDPSAGMLEVARRKVAAAGLAGRVELGHGDAEALPLADASVDGVIIAFGIRNVPDRERALREMARVTRRQGRIVILELSEPRSGLLAPLARFHIHHVVPRLGAWLSGGREYRYLESSIAAFPEPRELADLMRRCGCAVRLIRPLTFGACCLYVSQPADVAQPANVAQPAEVTS